MIKEKYTQLLLSNQIRGIVTKSVTQKLATGRKKVGLTK